MRHKLYWYFFRDPTAADTFFPAAFVIGIVVTIVWLWVAR